MPLAQLAATCDRTYKGRHIDLEKRGLYVHGVESNSGLPTSVASLGPVPSHVTPPIACGKIEKSISEERQVRADQLTDSTRWYSKRALHTPSSRIY